MLDRHLLARLRPVLDAAGQWLGARGVAADHVTWTAFGLGVAAATAIASGAFLGGLALLWLSRALDGLDGSVARSGTPTDRGAFLDITLDFLFYASIPLAFALADPPANALPAAVLLAAFIGTGSSFLAYAVLAAKRGLASTAYPDKGFYYLGGLTEGSETLLCFSLMCLWPQYFAGWAYGFATLCGLTIATRIAAGWHAFADR
ncbi:CDP-alcohol phosphatidyltransferase family protein [Schlegelella sp. S2-27]|uniref:CDP-alcohol phosphatidyltransferase family protein n=1 Tax=Caldimonas mangrovi TaxID=2944811 RepID=A0ABT0YLN1_9BURK|nr:CDP-alcohol phosphatidyltransferase family protein [Caldimonas mangrovi]MCM5679641.1 CDP-alcohol phosphatidyltransferase family protein [Caldimonas mangrovi]